MQQGITTPPNGSCLLLHHGILDDIFMASFAEESTVLSISTTQVPPPSDWQSFEHLCWLLWRAIWNDEGAQKNGRQGQPQNGVDVFGQPTRRRWAGVQCKGKDNFQAKKVSERELKEEVRKAKRFQPRLSEFILATTGVRDAKIQKCARTITDAHQKKRLFSVRVCSWDDIRDLLEEHDEVVSELYAGAAFAKDSRSHSDSISKLLNALEKRQRESLREEFNAQTRTAVNVAMLVGGIVSKSDDLSSAHLSDISPEQVSEILSILGKTKRKSQQPKTSTSTLPTAVLPPHQTRILGIISVSPIPFSLANFKAIFPGIDWDKHLRYFKRRNLIESKGGRYRVAARIKQSFIKKEKDKLPYLQEWIATLQPLKWHPDTALFLVAQQVSAGQLTESVCTLVDAAEAALPGYWNDAYLSMLLKMDHPKVLNCLTNDQRARHFNSVALCLSRAGRHEESVKWFLQLRRFSKRVRNNWGIGQSYHNCGVVYVELGELSRAEECFRKTIQHARKTRDRLLLGRSLYEFAMTISQTSYREAAKLLSQSDKVTKQVGDDAGLLGVNHGYGTLALQRGDYQDAIRWFTKAERIARNIGHYHAQALEQFNIGKAHSDLKKYEQALVHFRRAQKMAAEDELMDVLVFAVSGEALALKDQGKNYLAEKAFRRLFRLHSEAGDHADAAIALHDVGAILMCQRKYEEARKVLSHAAQLARRNKVLDWAYQCQADIAKCRVAEGSVGKAISTLRRMAANEDRRRLHGVAAKLWSDVVLYSVENKVSGARIFEDVERGLQAAAQVPNGAALKAHVYANLYLWKWGNQDYAAGMKALEDMLECAKSAGDDEIACRAQDQIGVCLQKLERFPEAIRAHRSAVRIARRLRDPDFLATSLHNLSEALRNTGRLSEAVRVCVKAEADARNRGNHESAISVAHNRALALEHQGKFDDAEEVFRKCRDEARRRKLWSEYVRALHALANMAWVRGNPDIAERRYAKALQAADKYNAMSRYQICLNYANALRWRNQSERAIEVLGSATSQFGSIPAAHRYHSELAALYADIGNTKLAAKHWELAHLSADRVGDDYALALSAGALAEIHDDRGRLEEADRCYQSALEHEVDSKLRVTLLLQRMGVLLQMKKQKEAHAVFDEIQHLAAGQTSQDEYVDALIMIGDYNWTKVKSPREALKAYFAAMAIRGARDVDQFLEIGAMITARLSHIEARDKPRRLAGLKRSIARWIEQHHGLDLRERNGGMFLWPFSAAARLLEVYESSSELSAAEFTAVVQKEVAKALA